MKTIASIGLILAVVSCFLGAGNAMRRYPSGNTALVAGVGFAVGFGILAGCFVLLAMVAR